MPDVPAPSPAPATAAKAADWALARAEQQALLFAERPSRTALARLDHPWAARPVSIRVHRNQPFEFVASLLKPFLAYAGLEGRITIGDYDDSLAFAPDGEADLEIVWLDFSRYAATIGPVELAAWLAERLQGLRARTTAPILVADWPADDDRAQSFNAALQAAFSTLPGLRVCPADEVRRDLGPSFFDERMAGVGATRLSAAANMAFARQFGLRWIPAALEPRIKAVVFDLDNTLWGGVVGEDGPEGLVFDAGYQALHRRLEELHGSGVLLALLSRNQPADVAAAFARLGEPAWPLDRFAARQIGWAPKANGLAQVARDLRIGPDAMLFVDDNAGELASVGAAHPGLRTLLAGPSPADTLNALRFCPGLFAWAADETDTLRATDLAANEAREALAATAGDQRSYVESLKVKVGVWLARPQDAGRLHQLSVKTNQFNLALRRFGEAEVAARIADPDTPVAAVALSDRLADAGLVGAVFMRRIEGALRVEELCISCRALGRGVEDVMVSAALRAGGADAVEQVVFEVDLGSRNAPARDWLSRFAGVSPPERPGSIPLRWDAAAVAQRLAGEPVEITFAEP